MKYYSQLAFYLVEAVAKVFAVHGYLTGVALKLPAEHCYCRGFSRAVHSQKRKQLAALNLKAKVVDRLNASEAFVQMIYFDDVFHHTRPFRFIE